MTVDTATVFVEDQNVFKTEYEPNTLINATHLENIRAAYTKLHKSEDLSALRLLIIFKGKIEISQDVSERYISSRIRKKTGEALVSSDPVTQEYLKAAGAIMNSVHPVRVFETESEARDWLESL
jgi:hypothetical protein